MQRILALLVMAAVALAAIPANFTWGPGGDRNYLTPTTNQNNPNRCESGWAWATINSLNARINIQIARGGLKLPLVSLSTQVLLECDELDFGCLGVRIPPLRASQRRPCDGSASTTSLIPPAIATKRGASRMARLVPVAASARPARLKTTVRGRPTPRFTR
jgi:hypothetical protein